MKDDKNIRLVLDRFMECVESELNARKLNHNHKWSTNGVMNICTEAYKNVLREMLITGCPYANIWECKR